MPIRSAARALRYSLAFGVLACAVSASAQVAVELAAGAADGRVDCIDARPCDRSRAGAKVAAGYRWSSGLELQASWLRAQGFQGGDTTPSGLAFGGDFDVDAFGVTVGYRWSFAPQWSLTGRAGAAVARTVFDNADAASANQRKTTLQPLAGVALAYQLSPAVALGVGLDVTRFKAHDRHGALRLVGAVAQFSF